MCCGCGADGLVWWGLHKVVWMAIFGVVFKKGHLCTRKQDVTKLLRDCRSRRPFYCMETEYRSVRVDRLRKLLKRPKRLDGLDDYLWFRLRIQRLFDFIVTSYPRLPHTFRRFGTCSTGLHGNIGHQGSTFQQILENVFTALYFNNLMYFFILKDKVSYPY